METREYKTTELVRRFLPYYKEHVGTVALDLFCAALTTICELVLPLIMRHITNEGMRDLAALSVETILCLGGLYLGLRIIDSIANYYMADVGHVMGCLFSFAKAFQYLLQQYESRTDYGTDYQ